MKPTHQQYTDFLAHKPILGVNFEHNEAVQVVSGKYKNKKGSLISIEEVGEDPLFLLEFESGLDAYVRQSQIRQIKK